MSKNDARSEQGSTLTTRQKWLAIVSLFVIGATVLYVKKWAFFIPHFPKMFFGPFLVLALGLVVACGVFFSRSCEIDRKALLREALPLIIYYAVTFAVLIAGTLRAHDPLVRVAGSIATNYWMLYAALPFAYLIGVVNRRTPRRWIAFFFVVIMTVAVISGLGELLRDFGISNPVGNFFYWLNQVANRPFASWSWNHIESLRLTGFTNNPNIFGYFAVIAFAWACTGKGDRMARIIVAVESLLVVFFSASRTSLLALLAVLICVTVIYRKDIKAFCFATRRRKALFFTVLAVLGVAVVAVVVMALTRQRLADFGLLGRLVSADQQVNAQGSGSLTSQLLNALMSGRGDLWTAAWRVISAHPWGAWLTVMQMFSMNVHNDFLASWLQGGPLMFAAFVALMAWMATRKTEPASRALPLCLCLISVITSLFDNTFTVAYSPHLVFFLLGVYSISTTEYAALRAGGDAGGGTQEASGSSSSRGLAFLLRLGRPFANLYYAGIKRRHPVRRKVTLLSRQSSEATADFTLLIEALRAADPELEIAVHCLYDEGDTRALKTIAGHLSEELRDVASSRAVVLDGYSPAISYFNQRPGLYVLQMWHALGAIKKFSLQTLDTSGGRSSTLAKAARMHRGYSQVLCGGEGSVPFFAEAFNVEPERIATMLLPRADTLRALRSFAGASGRLLYAPTFRDSPRQRARWCQAALELAHAAEGAGLQLTISLHPLAAAQLQRDGLSDELAALAPYLETERSTQDLMAGCADVITDYSAVVFEAALAGRNVWFYDYDLDEYRNDRGLNIDTSLELPEATFFSAATLIDALRGVASRSEARAASQAFFARYLVREPGSAAAQVAGFLKAHVLSDSDASTPLMAQGSQAPVAGER
ncbi:MAG: CDP-glycerol glycerophosphotransferase family protein [Coriobacteriia bacterium]|nr:CDP-glycerol glycerophosphotransferase family protein [Coriobacteriia bacterium]